MMALLLIQRSFGTGMAKLKVFSRLNISYLSLGQRALNILKGWTEEIARVINKASEDLSCLGCQGSHMYNVFIEKLKQVFRANSKHLPTSSSYQQYSGKIYTFTRMLLLAGSVIISVNRRWDVEIPLHRRETEHNKHRINTAHRVLQWVMRSQESSRKTHGSDWWWWKGGMWFYRTTSRQNWTPNAMQEQRR